MTYSDLRPRTKLCWSARRKRRKADSVWWAVRPSEPAMLLIRRFAFSSVISRDSRFTPRMPRKELPVAETNWPSATELPPALSEKVCSTTMLLSSSTYQCEQPKRD